MQRPGTRIWATTSTSSQPSPPGRGEGWGRFVMALLGSVASLKKPGSEVKTGLGLGARPVQSMDWDVEHLSGLRTVMGLFRFL